MCGRKADTTNCTLGFQCNSLVMLSLVPVVSFRLWRRPVKWFALYTENAVRLGYYCFMVFNYCVIMKTAQIVS